MSPVAAVLRAIVLSVALQGGGSFDELCYADESNPYLDFATITPYKHAEKNIAPVEGCRAEFLWLAVRHGTRFPKKRTIRKLQKLNGLRNKIVDNHQGTLCTKDLENLKNFYFKLSTKNEMLLSEQGKEDHYLLGGRIRNYFPEIMNNSLYSPENFTFRHSKTSRTKRSAKYFFKGVFGQEFNAPSTHLPPPLDPDVLLAPFKNCPQRIKFSKHSITRERNDFQSSVYIKEVLSNVNKKLFGDEYLDRSQIFSIYDACRYERSWVVRQTSPWCAAFSRVDLQAMEYYEDLWKYYDNGPGNPNSRRLSCPLVKDLYEHLSNIFGKLNHQTPRASFYFTHDDTLAMLSTGLGITDNHHPLTADSYINQRHRKFRLSNLTPFTGNVLAVDYRCSRGDRRRVQFLVGEQVVKLPGCQEDGFCTWSQVQRMFDSFVNNLSCTDKDFCSMD